MMMPPPNYPIYIYVFSLMFGTQRRTAQRNNILTTDYMWFVRPMYIYVIAGSLVANVAIAMTLYFTTRYNK